MGRLLSRFSISIQVSVIGAVALFGFTLVGALYAEILHRSSSARVDLDRSVQHRALTNQVVIGLLQLRRREKDFLLRHDEVYLNEYAQQAALVTGQMSDLASRLTAHEDQALLGQIRDGTAAYLGQFRTVVDDSKAIGLSEEDGFRGTLRRAVHDIEDKVLGRPESALMISMLMMRRHEKDFMERQDTKYGDMLRQEAGSFVTVLQASSLSPAEIAAIRGDLTIYLRDFAQLEEGITRRLGNLEKLSVTFQEIEPKVFALYRSVSGRADEIKARNEATQATLSALLATSLTAIALITSLMAWLVGRGIARPVAAMTGAMTALAAGEMTVEVPGQNRGDEIGAMAAAMEIFKDHMIEAFRLTEEQTAGNAAKARRQAAIDRHTQDFGASISGVMGSLAVAASDMREAADVMARAAASVHEQAAGTAEGAGRSSRDLTSVAAAVEQMTASIDEIARQVATATRVAGEAVHQAETGQDAIKALAETASRIGDVVGLINNIANQTNLLALNATIEAARAGEAGKGFAVVAGEVKILAGQTARATADIGGQIAAIQAATNSAIAVMSEIGSVIGRMNQVSAAIAAAVEEQSVTTRGIAASVQAITAAIEGTSVAMDQVVGNANEAGKVVGTVTSGSAEIGRQAGLLRAEVDQFLKAVQTDDGNGAMATPRVTERLRFGQAD